MPGRHVLSSRDPYDEDEVTSLPSEFRFNDRYLPKSRKAARHLIAQGIELDMKSELAATLVGQAASPQEAFELFQQHFQLLQDYKFVIRGMYGTQPSHAIDRTFTHGAGVHTLFAGSPLLVLDQRIVREMQQGQAQFHFDYSVALDTQAVSYLHPYICGRDPAISNPDLKEVFNLISRPEVSVDPLPYIHENTDQIGLSSKIDAKIMEKLRAYEVLRTIDSSALEMGDVRSTLTDNELDQRAAGLMAAMRSTASSSREIRSLAVRYQYFHSCLLAIVDIYLDDSLDPRAKLLSFAHFCDHELSSMAGREMQLAHWLFNSPEPPEFFRKLKDKDIKSIRNMSWDLFHLRQMEHNYVLTSAAEADFFFPAILTFDKSLREVIDLHPLRAIAWSTRERSPMTFYYRNPLDLMFASSQQADEFMDRFYSYSARERRALQIGRSRDSISELVRRWERRLQERHGFTPGRERAMATYPLGW